MLYVLDHFSADDIERYKTRYQELYDFFWAEFAHYAQGRSKKSEPIRRALLEGCETFRFENWHRLVAQKYSNAPLSAKGSIQATQGGRFNIGSLDPTKFTPFAALYAAEDVDTARSEWFRCDYRKKRRTITPADFSLTSEASHLVTRTKGRLDLVLDLTKKKTLELFLRQIRKMRASDELEDKAERLGLNRPKPLRTLDELRSALFAKDWAFYPTFLEIPHNSQVFGLLAKLAGVQALIYPSKFTGSRCIAIFPENLADPAIVELVDPAPKGTITSLTASNWRDLT